MKVNSQGYVQGTKCGKRSVFIIRHSSANTGCVLLNFVTFPKHLIGRRVRFKVELVEEEK